MGTVLLTGATGFVGRHLLKELENRAAQTSIVARPGWQSRIEIDEDLTRVFETDDLFGESSTWWRKSLEGVDLIIHCAWIATPGSYLTSEKNLDCLAGTLNMAKAAVGANVRRFVGLGTCIEYKSSDRPLSIDSPLDPKTPYSAAKLAAFLTLREWFADQDVSFLWCRLFHPYGPGEHSKRLAPYLHETLSNGLVAELSEGSQIRDFIDVRTAAELIVDGAFSDFEGPANICSGEGKSVRRFAEEIAEIYGQRNLLRFGSRSGSKEASSTIVGIPNNFER